MMAMRHDPGMARPRGWHWGTGALLNLVKSKGGVVLTDQSVQKVLIDDGKAVGVRLPMARNTEPTRRNFQY